MTEDERALLLICADFARQAIASRMNVVSAAELMGAVDASTAVAEKSAGQERIEAAKKAIDRIDDLIDRVGAHRLH